MIQIGKYFPDHHSGHRPSIILLYLTSGIVFFACQTSFFFLGIVLHKTVAKITPTLFRIKSSTSQTWLGYPVRTSINSCSTSIPRLTKIPLKTYISSPPLRIGKNLRLVNKSIISLIIDNASILIKNHTIYPYLFARIVRHFSCKKKALLSQSPSYRSSSPSQLLCLGSQCLTK